MSESLRSAMPRNEEIRLVIRYRGRNLEADLWNNGVDGWDKIIVTTAQCDFSESVRTLLRRTPDHKFSGRLRNLSGVLSYTEDKTYRTFSRTVQWKPLREVWTWVTSYRTRKSQNGMGRSPSDTRYVVEVGWP